MEEIRTTAALVEEDALAGGSVTAVLPRPEAEALAGADEPVQLWLEIGSEYSGETRLVALDLAPGSVEELLRRAVGDDIVLGINGEALEELLDAPDVEAHGLRSALALAVASGALIAPAADAAVAQISPAATKAKVTPAAKAQVTPATKRGQLKPAAKSQAVQSLVVKATGLRLLTSQAPR
jgi:hypothetical protein